MTASEWARPTTSDLRFAEIARRLECIDAGQDTENKQLTELLVASTKSMSERAELREEVGEIKSEMQREFGEIKNVIKQVQSHTHSEEFKMLDKVIVTLWGTDANGGMVARQRMMIVVGALLATIFTSILAPIVVWFVITALEHKLPFP